MHIIISMLIECDYWCTCNGTIHVVSNIIYVHIIWMIESYLMFWCGCRYVCKKPMDNPVCKEILIDKLIDVTLQSFTICILCNSS